MCFSLESSILVGLTSLLFAGYLWWRNWKNDRWLAVFLPTVALMQFAEAMIWTDLKDERGWNAGGGRLGLFALVLQTWALSMGGVIWSRPSSFRRKAYLITLSLLTALSSAAFLPTIVNADPAALRSRVGSHGHLKWGFLSLFHAHTPFAWTYQVVFVTAWTAWRPFWQGMLLGLFGAITYYYAKVYDDKEWGSVWCYTANVVGLFQVLFRHLARKKE